MENQEKQHKRRVHYSGKYPKKFEEKYGLAFTILADPERKAIEAYDPSFEVEIKVISVKGDRIQNKPLNKKEKLCFHSKGTSHKASRKEARRI